MKQIGIYLIILFNITIGFSKITGEWHTVLSTDNVLQVASKENALWAATSNGVVRYIINENHCTTHRMPNNAFVTSVLVTTSEAVIVGTQNGVFVFNGTEFIRPDWVAFTEGARITNLFEDSSGKIWAASVNGGIYCFNKSGFSKNWRLGTGLRHDFVTSVLERKPGEMWLGTVSSLDIIRNHSEIDTVTFQIGRVFNMTRDSAGFIWTTGTNKILRINDKNETEEIPYKSGRCFGVTFDGNVFLGSQRATPLIFNGETFEEMYYNDSLFTANFVHFTKNLDNPTQHYAAAKDGVWEYSGEGKWKRFTIISNDIRNIYIDSDSTVMFCTLKGVSTYKNGIWNELLYNNDPLKATANDILRNAEGNLVVGNPKSVSILLPDTLKIVPINTPTSQSGTLTSISEDNEGNIWYGTFFNDAQKIIGDTTIHLPVIGGSQAYNVRKIFCDRNGDMWIASFDGVRKWVDTAWVHMKDTNGPTNSWIYCGTEDLNGHFWFGTENGLGEFNGTEWKVYFKEDGLDGDKVVDIAVDKFNRKWFATNEGLTMYNDNVWTSVLKAGIGKVAVDYNGYVWATTASGLHFASLDTNDVIIPVRRNPGRYKKSHRFMELHSGNARFDVLGRRIYRWPMRKSPTMLYLLMENEGYNRKARIKLER